MTDLSNSEPPPADWSRIGPAIDEVMHELRERDREAVLLRHFENRPFAEVGARQGIGENAARMRVDRALERLRERLARRGITSSAVALGALLTDHAVAAAPAGLAGTISGAATAGAGAWTFGSLLTGAKLLTGAAGAAAIAAGVTLFTEHQATDAMRAELAGIEVRAASANQLRAAVAALNARQLSQSELDRLQREHAELDRLRAEVSGLRAHLAASAVATAPPPLPPASSGTKVPVSALDELPRPTLQIAPVYPLPMLFDGAPGKVDVRFTVDQNGDVTDAVAIRSTDPAFEDAAVAAIRKWKFTPGRRNGLPVNAVLQVPVVFTQVDHPPPSGPRP